VNIWVCIAEMRKFLTQVYGYGYQQGSPSPYSKIDLARSVLAELPDQLVLWMRKLKAA